MNILTWTYLRKLGACRKDVRAFRKSWPKGAPVTMASIRKARKLGLGVDWLAIKLDNAKVDALWAEYDAKVDAVLLAALGEAK
jgi:hypothetical protein